MTREKADHIVGEIGGWVSNVVLCIILTPFFLLCLIVELLGLEDLFA